MNRYLESILDFSEVKDFPDVVIMEVTHGCNLRCAHCYNPESEHSSRHRRAPGAAALLRIIHSIPGPENVCIAFTGAALAATQVVGAG